MDVYIDCSGDEGFQLGKKKGAGSSQYYVIAGLRFPNPDAVVRRIRLLHYELRMPQDTEFKFSDLKQHKRYAFLAALSSYNVKIHALVVPKDDVTSSKLRGNGIMFRRFFCRQFLENGLKSADIHAFIDDFESCNEPQQQECVDYLMREINSRHDGKLMAVTMVRSHDYELVQAADMCAGAINAAREGDPQYRNLIEIRIVNEWTFKAKPKRENKKKP